jgi:host factor-I protein
MRFIRLSHRFAAHPPPLLLELLLKILYRKRKRGSTMQNGGKIQNLQDAFLNQLRKEKVPVLMYLTNGVRLKGVIKGFDNFVILLKESSQQLIYKHAVSTIQPEREIDLRQSD